MSHESKVHQERTAEANTKRMSTRSYCQLLQWKVFFHTNRAVSVLCGIVSTEIIHHNRSRALILDLRSFIMLCYVMLCCITKTHPAFWLTAPPACPWPKLPLCDERNPWNWKLHEVPTNFGPCQWDFQSDLMPCNGIRCHTCSFPCEISIFSNKAPWQSVISESFNSSPTNLFAPRGQNPSEFSSLPRHLSCGWVEEWRIRCPENSRPFLGWSHPRVRIMSWWEQNTPIRIYIKS